MHSINWKYIYVDGGLLLSFSIWNRNFDGNEKVKTICNVENIWMGIWNQSATSTQIIKCSNEICCVRITIAQIPLQICWDRDGMIGLVWFGLVWICPIKLNIYIIVEECAIVRYCILILNSIEKNNLHFCIRTRTAAAASFSAQPQTKRNHSKHSWCKTNIKFSSNVI